MAGEAFKGIKVLDVAEGVAGSYCAKLLADFGSEVVKVEETDKGGKLRNAPPFSGGEPHPEKSGTFFYLNTNKKGITLNLETETGAKILKRLAGDADIIVESFAPGYMRERGVSYDVLKETNNKIIMTSITWFGQSGLYKDYKATNFTAYGLGGAMYMGRPTRYPKTRPVTLAGYQAEYLTGLLSFIATVAALTSRVESGKGAWIDMSVMECVASTLTGILGEYSYMGMSRTTTPWAVHGYPTQENDRCKDGWVNLTPGLGGAPNIALLIDEPEMQDAPIFARPGVRMAEPEKFDAIVQPWLKEHDKWEIMREAQQLRLAFTPVLEPLELMEDEQLKAREYFVKVKHPVMGEVAYCGAPAKLSETPCRAGRAPLLGEDNENVFGLLGITKEELQKLHERGIT